MNIPDEELWAARQSLRAFLFNFMRERARNRWTQEHVSAARVVAAATMFDHNTLTIGFARRFTGYKRPELIFLDAERLARILTAPGRAVQIIFAGKATLRTTSASTTCSGSTGARSIRCSAGASASSTITTCTSPTTSYKAATCG
jgi:glucan phosphorylase